MIGGTYIELERLAVVEGPSIPRARGPGKPARHPLTLGWFGATLAKEAG